jgi:hypothetical protein
MRGQDCLIEVPNHPSPHPSGTWHARFSELAPLTDPGVSEWADNAVKRVTKPEPVIAKVTA